MKLIFWLASENLPLYKLKSFINFSRFIEMSHIKASNDNDSMYDNHTNSLENYLHGMIKIQYLKLLQLENADA